ncbi:MAG TPA: site-2 protease family protein, partial [Abditibacteriaceae bacterium]|nr:site-2 protease family protein [Abditibacteriaceae bacterium]
EDRGWFGGLGQLLFGSVPIGTWFGIRVRIHSTLILLIAVRLLFAGARDGIGFRHALTSSLILFGIILLHEFGHCIAARRVGGYADEILLWPLGGLAFIHTPRRPWPSFVGAAGGPLVNVIICAVTGVLLLAMSGGRFGLPWNPLLTFGDRALMNDESFLLIASQPIAYYLWWIYLVSFSLFFFNLLPIYPLDGGQMLQTMLWPKLGYYKSMYFACTTGMAAAVLMGLLGLAGNFMLLLIGISGFMYCYQTRMALPATADEAWRDAQSYAPRKVATKAKPRRSHLRVVPPDDKTSPSNLNPLEWLARRRRRKQFERLMKDD